MQIPIVRLENISHKALKKVLCLDILNLVNAKVV